MTIALVQRKTALVNPAAGSIAGTFDTTPVVGNLMVGTCSAGNATWNIPTGWLQAVQGTGVNMELAIFYRVVIAGDSTGPYSFTQASGTDVLELELEEWGGFPAGTITLDLSIAKDTAPAVAATLTPAATTSAIELIKVAIAVGGTGAATAGWSAPFTPDSPFLAQALATAHNVTSVIQPSAAVNVTWTNSIVPGAGHSSTMVLCSFKVVATSGIALVQRFTTNTTNTQVTGAFSSVPIVGNLMVASCCGISGAWTPPTGWGTAVAGSGVNMNLAIFYRVVQLGDGTNYTFIESSTSGPIELEIEEWGGFPTGTIIVDISSVVDTPIALQATLSPGPTTSAVELVKVAIGIGGAVNGVGAASASWNQGLIIDSQLISAALATAHLITNGITNLTPTVVQWTTASHSSTLAMVSFKVGTITSSVALAQPRQVATNAGASISASFNSKPIANNLMIATCSAPTGTWSLPAGWATAVSFIGNMSIAMFWRIVQTTDTVGPYQFNRSDATAFMTLELEEWTGFGSGTIVTDISAVIDSSGGLTNTVNPGTTSAAVELVKAVVAAGGSGAVSPVWNQGLTVDSPFINQSMTTAHLATTAIQSFSPTTVTWSSTSGVITVPSIPNVIVAVPGNAQATVIWSTPVSNGGSPITSYRVVPYIAGVAQTAIVVSGVPAPTSTLITGLTNGTTYTFTVAATNSVGTGGVSVSSSAVSASTIAGLATTTWLFANNSSTTITSAVATVPAKLTPEIWTVSSTASLPIVTAGINQFAAMIAPGVGRDLSPEIVLVIATIDSTNLLVLRGYGGTIKTHAVNDIMDLAVDTSWFNKIELASQKYLPLTGTTAVATLVVYNGSTIDLTLAANITNVSLIFLGAIPGIPFRFVLRVIQDSVGSRSIFIPSPIRWAGGTVPSVSTTPGAMDIVSFVSYDGGISFDGFVLGLNI